jgi:hypothetical protein
MFQQAMMSTSMKKRMAKTPPCLSYDGLQNHIPIAMPTNLQVIPDS